MDQWVEHRSNPSTFHPDEWDQKKAGGKKKIDNILVVKIASEHGEMVWNRTTYPPKKSGIIAAYYSIQPKDLWLVCVLTSPCQGEEKAESTSFTLWVTSLAL